MNNLRITSIAALGLVLLAGGASAASLPTFAGATPAVSALPVYSWMSPEIGAAWTAGYKGQGVTITFVDDFKSASMFSGKLGTGTQTLRHGEWTRLEGSMIAPSAAIVSQDFTSGRAVMLARGLNVVNLSYAMYATAGYTANQIGWSSQESSIINYATGSAVISKAAGNDSVTVGAANSSGQVDYLNLALVGKSSAIFVGALNSNGTTTQKASLASYSNKAGNNLAVQKNFLTVGVAGDKTGLYGTSFAAPIVSGYAAVLGSKFTSASATQITNQLLNTARQDTVTNFNAAVYGRGEASITRALAPVSIR
jgi:subtilisin family serine protease